MLSTGFFNRPMANNAPTTYAQSYQQLFNLHQNYVQQAVNAVLQYRKTAAQYRATSQALLALLREFEEQGDFAVEGHMSKVNQTMSFVGALITGGVIFACLLLVAGYFFLRQWVIKPLATLDESLQSITNGNGNLNLRVEVQRQDEIGQLAEHMNELIETLQKMVWGLTGQSAMIFHKIEQNRGIVAATMRRSQNAAENADSVAAASNQVAHSAQTIARNCEQSSDAVGIARKNTNATRDIMGATAKGMERVKDCVTDAASHITSLKTSTEKIGEIVGVISGISAQTNLLALNAAIEAARAGEQGRGFAVVADEVRTLAQRTSASTLEITAVIQSIQHLAEGVFDVMADCVREVEEKTRNSQLAITSLNELQSSVDQLSQLLDGVATAAGEQSRVVTHISERVTTIAQDAQGVTQEAKANLTVAQELNDCAAELNRQLGSFKA